MRRSQMWSCVCECVYGTCVCERERRGREGSGASTRDTKGGERVSRMATFVSAEYSERILRGGLMDRRPRNPKTNLRLLSNRRYVPPQHRASTTSKSPPTLEKKSTAVGSRSPFASNRLATCSRRSTFDSPAAASFLPISTPLFSASWAASSFSCAASVAATATASDTVLGSSPGGGGGPVTSVCASVSAVLTGSVETPLESVTTGTTAEAAAAAASESAASWEPASS